MREALLVVLTIAMAIAVTGGARRFALRFRLLDLPNARSAHSVPTPRLGGLGIIVPFVVGSTLLLWSNPTERGLLLPSLAAMVAISALGVADDIRPVPPFGKLVIQVLVASAFLYQLGTRRFDQTSELLGLPPIALQIASALWLVWATNLFNFMDGADGLAAGQTFFACAGLATAEFMTGNATFAWILILLGSATLGFLPYNFPRARIFMGDGGSTAIGFFFATLPLLPTARPIRFDVVLIALGFFIFDSSVTLARRILNGERFIRPHRTHFYQRPIALGFRSSSIVFSLYPIMASLAVAACVAAVSDEVGRGLCVAYAVAVFGAFAGYVTVLEKRRRRSSALTDVSAASPDSANRRSN